MEFPNEGEVIDGFIVELVSVQHEAMYDDVYLRYEYPTELIVMGDGTPSDVIKAFERFFNVEKQFLSSYGNAYQCYSGEMNVQSIGEKRFRIEARGSCVRKRTNTVKEETIEDMKNAALGAYEAIFDDHKSFHFEGKVYPVEKTPRAKLRVVKIKGHSFLEQNPEKSSRWAKMAKEGHSIIWVLKGRRYLAQVRDGVFYDFRKKET
jgi:hypothetical protein